MSQVPEAEDYLPSYETEAARRAWRRRTSLEMIISGCIGLVTSFVLSIEAWQLAPDSSTRFGCDISSVLSCSTVAQTWQARILGFPNAFLGIFFEAVVLAISVAIFSGVKFPRWYMLGTNLLYTIARINIRDGVIQVPEGLRRVVAQGLDWALWGLIVFGVLAMVVAKYGLKLLS